MGFRGYICVVALVVAPMAWADDWFCTEVASQRSGSVIRSCGVGHGADENEARTSAFENARREFGAVCNASTDCRDHEVSVEPERTQCEPEGEGFKCYRLVVFTIGEGFEHNDYDDDPLVLGKPEPAPATPPPPVVTKPIVRAPMDVSDLAAALRWGPTELEDTSKLPKIKVGMTKAEVLQKFGKPDVVRANDYAVAVFYRDRAFCDGRSCFFRFEKRSGIVTQVQDFRYEYTGALE